MPRKTASTTQDAPVATEPETMDLQDVQDAPQDVVKWVTVSTAAKALNISPSAASHLAKIGRLVKRTGEKGKGVTLESVVREAQFRKDQGTAQDGQASLEDTVAAISAATTPAEDAE